MMNKIVVRYLIKRKKRTIFSIIGIAISVALVVGISGIVLSFKNLITDEIIKNDGEWHYSIVSKNKEKELEIANKINSSYNESIIVEKVGKVSKLENVFVSNIKKNENGFKVIKSQLSLAEGRFPEDSDEILIPIEYKDSYDHVSINLNQEIFVSVSSSYSDEVTFEKNFKVVGFTFDEYVKSFYTYNLDTKSEIEGHQVFLKLDYSIKNFDEYVNDILIKSGVDKDDVFILQNFSLLFIKGKNGDMFNLLFKPFLFISIFILILMGIMIKNSLSMSISDKVEQLGILRCLGATKSQIRNLIFKEAIIMWAIALALGFIISFLSIVAVIFFIRSLDVGLNCKFIPPFYEFIITFLVSLIVVLAFSLIPSIRASKISAVDAIRGTAFIKLDKVEKSKGGIILRKIFGGSGFLASKNVRRNKKRFRSTITSITIAVIIFIFFIDLGNQINTSIHFWTKDGSIDFLFSSQYDDKSDPENNTQNLYDYLNEINGVEKLASYKLYADVFSDDNDEKENLLDSFYSVRIISVSRYTYDSMEIKGDKPSYNDLIFQKAGLIYQTSISIGRNGVKEQKILDKKSGDVVNFKKALGLDFKVAEELECPPWFTSNVPGIYMIMPDDVIMENVEKKQVINNVCMGVARKDVGHISTFLKNDIKTNSDIYSNFYFSDIYQNNKNLKGGLIILELFMIIFFTIIILICLITLINTINTNLQNRQCEIATLRSIGMSNRQLLKMLVIESTSYGLISNFYGFIIAGLIKAGFYKLISGEFPIQSDYMMLIIIGLISLIGTITISLWSGYGSIKTIIKTSIIDGIRSKE